MFGFFKPSIFLPTGLSPSALEYVLLHEMTHISRRDHLVKFAAFAILALHWFNPLAWFAFLLVGTDMEMSCDEHVIEKLGKEIRADYSRTLLSFAGKSQYAFACPIAFCESGIKERVKNVLNTKKSSRIAVVCSLALVAAVSFGLMTNRAESADHEAYYAEYGDEYALLPERAYDGEYESFDEIEYVLLPAWTNYNPAFGTPSRFNRDVPLKWTWHFPTRHPNVPAHLRNFFALEGFVESEIARLLVDHMNETAMPEGWFLTHIDLGGRAHHLYHEFLTHEVMLNPYAIALEFVAIDTIWSHEAEISLMQQAKLLFEHFEEVVAVSFRVQKVDRAGGMTNYKNAQLTRERVPIKGEDTWCHKDYVTNLIPFYVNVGTPDDIRVLFTWVPQGFELHEVEYSIESLPFGELGFSINTIVVSNSFLQYGPYVYSFSIHFNEATNISSRAGRDGFLAEQAMRMFDTFQELNTVLYYFGPNCIDPLILRRNGV